MKEINVRSGGGGVVGGRGCCARQVWGEGEWYECCVWGMEVSVEHVMVLFIVTAGMARASGRRLWWRARPPRMYGWRTLGEATLLWGPWT